MKGLCSFIRWEMKNSLRFPIIELIVAIMFFSIFSKLFVIPIGVSSGGGSLAVVSNGMYYSMLQLFVPERVTLLYTIIIMFVSFLIAFTFANDIEKGIMRQYFSSPIPKRDIFLGKVIAVTIPLIAISSIATLAMMYMIEPGSFFSVPNLENIVIGILFAFSSLVFFNAGVSIIIALITKNTAVTAVSTFMLFYFFDMVGSNEFPFFPSRAMMDIVNFGIGQGYNILAVTFMPVMAVVTLCIGYYLFVAGVELS